MRSQVFLIVVGALALAQADLLNCDSVSCPGDLSPKCQINDTVASVLGIDSMQSAIDSKPLAWTIAVSYISGPDTGSILQKDFYLGVPEPVESVTESGNEACAIFFPGISSSLRFHPGSYFAEDNGNCDDALGSRCATDWVEQAKYFAQEFVAEGKPLDCASVTSKMQNSPPASCTVANGSWGDAISRNIDISPDAPFIQLGDCQASLNKDYRLQHVARLNATVGFTVDETFIAFTGGVVPVFTFFAPSRNASVAANTSALRRGLTEPETHLSCMKVVAKGGSSTSSETTQIGLAPKIAQSNIVLFGMLMWLLWVRI